MNRGLFFVVLLVATIGEIRAGGTGNRSPYILRNAELTLIDGTVHTGLCAGITADTFRLWQPGAVRNFGFGSIRSIAVHGSAHPELSMLYGIVIGGYVGLLTGGLGAQGGFSPANIRNFTSAQAGSSGPWTSAATFAFLGAIMGYLVTPVDGVQDDFDLSGSESDRRDEIDALREGVMRRPKHRFYLEIAAGDVTFGGQDSRSASPIGVTERARLALFRRAALTYSVTPHVAIGAGIVDFSEPSVTRESWGQDGYSASEQSSENLLYCLMARWAPFASRLPDWVSVDFGAGLGLATIDYRAVTYGNYGDSLSFHDQSLSTTPGVTVSGNLRLHPDDHLSLGLSIDYTAAPFITFRGVPDLALDSRRPGNMCVGFEFGFHF